MRHRRIGTWLPYGLLAAAALMIAFGVWRGEVDEVYLKARLICLECIGIG